MYSGETSAHDYQRLYQEDVAMLKESVEDTIGKILATQSTRVFMSYFHLSPIKLHLSFSLEGKIRDQASTEDYFIEWLISTIGIHFTDISDAVIKLLLMLNYCFFLHNFNRLQFLQEEIIL